MGVEVSLGKSYYKCPKDHRLEFSDTDFTYDSKTYKCVNCQVTKSCKESRYNCFMCKWNLCLSCAEVYRPKQVPMMKCMAGHDLIYKENKYPAGFFSCAQCNRQYPSNQKRWNCSMCNFDVCYFCRLPGPPGEPLPLPAAGGISMSINGPGMGYGMGGGMGIDMSVNASGYPGGGASVGGGFGPMGMGMNVQATGVPGGGASVSMGGPMGMGAGMNVRTTSMSSHTSSMGVSGGPMPVGASVGMSGPMGMGVNMGVSGGHMPGRGVSMGISGPMSMGMNVQATGMPGAGVSMGVSGTGRPGYPGAGISMGISGQPGGMHGGMGMNMGVSTNMSAGGFGGGFGMPGMSMQFSVPSYMMTTCFMNHPLVDSHVKDGYPDGRYTCANCHETYYCEANQRFCCPMCKFDLCKKCKPN
jgi:hypothetical protein